MGRECVVKIVIVGDSVKFLLLALSGMLTSAHMMLIALPSSGKRGVASRQAYP